MDFDKLRNSLEPYVDYKDMDKVLLIIQCGLKENISIEKKQEIIDEILRPSTHILHLNRQGWSETQLKLCCTLFVENNYPQGGITHKIKHHFFNHAKYQKPSNYNNRSGEKESTTDSIDQITAKLFDQ